MSNFVKRSGLVRRFLNLVFHLSRLLSEKKKDVAFPRKSEKKKSRKSEAEKVGKSANGVTLSVFLCHGCEKDQTIVQPQK